MKAETPLKVKKIDVPLEFDAINAPDISMVTNEINVDNQYFEEKTAPSSINKTNQSLTALWALGEAGGGLLGMFKLPLSGLIVSSFAVLVISLLCFYNRSASKPLLKAWMVVMMVKFAFHPLASPLAYFALTFQVLFVVFCTRFFQNRKTAIVVAAVGCLMQSCLMQLFLVQKKVIEYDFWHGANQFKMTHIADRFVLNIVQGNAILMGLYVFLFLIVGLLTGWMAYHLPQNIQRESQRLHRLVPLNVVPLTSAQEARKEKKKKRKNSYGLPRLAILFGVFLLITGKASGWTFVRLGLMWLLVFTNFVQKHLINWVQKMVNIVFGDEEFNLKSSKKSLPQLGNCIKQAWQNAKLQSNGLLRQVVNFVPILFALGMREEVEEAK
jgi:hypothetical protein